MRNSTAKPSYADALPVITVIRNKVRKPSDVRKLYRGDWRLKYLCSPWSGIITYITMWGGLAVREEIDGLGKPVVDAFFLWLDAQEDVGVVLGMWDLPSGSINKEKDDEQG